MANGNITLITIEPVAGELRPHLNEYGVETVQVFDGKQWLDFAQPTYESLLAENARLRAENQQLQTENERLFTTMLDMALDEQIRKAQE